MSIFIFHRVLPIAGELYPEQIDAHQFDQILGWLKSWFNVLPLDDAASRLRSGTLPSRAASITFDDGYADNCTVARPLLKKHGLSATFFIATGFLDGGRMWNDTVIESVGRCMRLGLDLSSVGLGIEPTASIIQKRDLIERIISHIKYKPPDERVAIATKISDLAEVEPSSNLMMSSAQVLMLHDDGMQIGAHTVSHPILACLRHADVQREIRDSKAHLESLLCKRISLFAYPNGIPGKDYRSDDVEAVRDSGFDAAVSTASGTANKDSDIMQLPRFTPWDRTKTRFGARLMCNMLSKQT